MLLADIRKAFDARPDTDRLATDELILSICNDPERPWKTHYRGDPITPRALAGLLKGFGIRSHTTRFLDGTQAKGFKRSQFEDSWSRYLPSSSLEGPLSVPSVPSRSSSQISVTANPHEQSDGTDGTDNPLFDGKGEE